MLESGNNDSIKFSGTMVNLEDLKEYIYVSYVCNYFATSLLYLQIRVCLTQPRPRGGGLVGYWLCSMF